MEPKYTKDDLLIILTALEESRDVIADPLKAFEAVKKLQKYPQEVVAFVTKAVPELLEKTESEEDYTAVSNTLLVGINLVSIKKENNNNQNQN